ncbi:stress-induced protein KIN2-like [Cynara cardunculus var. scolymus]|uniref:stress-induced protein KIN2-like n=1 Tax=Cynara cardunculus var. scolymus TaxID=59895 RepID=UPI000D627AC2|nr:stress-induced protein KIN2-like [Cynara cardunculus var. scolymus]
MNNTQSANFQAGQAKGQAEEKGSQLMDQASNAAQSAKDSMQQAGQQLQAKAQDAAQAVKDATGMNK